MTDMRTAEGSAPVQGPLWGARPRDWAAQEERHHSIYDNIWPLVDVPAGGSVLDVGCGAGTFCRLAAAQGYQVTGIDAAASLIDLAGELVPDGEFHVGDLQFLPFADDHFDCVTAFNSVQFAADPGAALAEIKRVARPAAPVVIVVWGRPEHSELTAIVTGLAPLLPPPPPGVGGPAALAEEHVLDTLIERAGLRATASGYLPVPLDYPDQEAFLLANLSTGVAAVAIRTSGEDAVRDAILRAAAPFRTASGGYRIEAESRYVIASA
ncbi:class I SAM-dependent methyltransferase [Nocardioides limicola]|uniref:class I SAM-dependent methyltransferase n=1 Tax=Nocardioides limicola TaxID=2803368 RepID=UPI00193B6799|nr:class I SAM-dependent methyltransferase [Nocardioides sp. DJM-14]